MIRTRVRSKWGSKRMHGFREETAAFKARKLAELANARQLAALQLACGIDLGEALDATPEHRQLIALRLQRAIERERLKGVRGHWAYDLNRHIALKQALNRLSCQELLQNQSDSRRMASRPRRRRTRNGAPKDAV
jgi:hypothetical protein